MTTPAVVVVGSVNEDVLIGLDRLPEPGETVPARSVERRPGGKGANQAVAAARAGAAVAMVGRVGDDGAGRRMLGSLAADAVDAGEVRVVPGVATGRAYVMVTAGGESTIVVEAGANSHLGADDVAGPVGRCGAAVLLTQLEVPVETVLAAVGAASAAGMRVVLTASPARALPAAAMGVLDPLVVNATEASFFLGPLGLEAEEMAARLLACGPRSVVVTLGDRGAVVADGHGVVALPAAPAGPVVDTTGAGDALAGTMAAALAAGSPLAESVEAGMHAAAAVIGRPGAR